MATRNDSSDSARSLALWVDIEGFSEFYRQGTGDRAMNLMSCLLLDIYRVGAAFAAADNNRWFVHQFGDGVIICPDNAWLESLLSAAIALSQSTLSRGGCLRAAISHGQLADITHCYREEMLDAAKKSDSKNRLQLAEGGLMTTNPVIGDALTKAYSLASKAKLRGPQLLVDIEIENHLIGLNVRKICRGESFVAIDWIHSYLSQVSPLLKKMRGPLLPVETLESNLRKYVSEFGDSLPCEWRAGAAMLLDSAVPIGPS